MRIALLNLTPLCILALVTLLILYYLHLSASPIPKPHGSNTHLEESMDGVLAKRFDASGHLIHMVTMESWQHLKGETATQMISPTLTLYHPDGSLWHITAEQGEALQTRMGGKYETIHLSHDVIIQQVTPKKPMASHPPLWWELKTDNLSFFPEKSLASTDAPVFVKGPDLTLQALGMRAYPDRHFVEFLKKVKTNYVHTKT